MALRVKIRVSSGDKEVVMPALVNSGYETDTPELLVPVKVAEALGLWPETKEAVMERYRVVGGGEVSAVRMRKCVKVEVLAEGYASKPIDSDIVVSEGEDEIIISDKLASRLGIVILDIGEGIWCFREEIGKRERR
ncbi:MAG: hypothetical protein ACXQTS_01035 [Candidatus Methanospirareceae archaeon]